MQSLFDKKALLQWKGNTDYTESKQVNHRQTCQTRTTYWSCYGCPEAEQHSSFKEIWKHSIQGTLENCSKTRSPSAGVQHGAGVETAMSKAVTDYFQKEPDWSLWVTTHSEGKSAVFLKSWKAVMWRVSDALKRQLVYHHLHLCCFFYLHDVIIIFFHLTYVGIPALFTWFS